MLRNIKTPYETCLKCDSGSILIVKSLDSIVEPMENGPIMKKSTSNSADSIAQLDVFEENGSEKGSKMAPTLIKPMENHQMGVPESIFSCPKYFFLSRQKRVSHISFYSARNGEYAETFLEFSLVQGGLVI